MEPKITARGKQTQSIIFQKLHVRCNRQSSQSETCLGHFAENLPVQNLKIWRCVPQRQLTGCCETSSNRVSLTYSSQYSPNLISFLKRMVFQQPGLAAPPMSPGVNEPYPASINIMQSGRRVPPTRRARENTRDTSLVILRRRGIFPLTNRPSAFLLTCHRRDTETDRDQRGFESFRMATTQKASRAETAGADSQRTGDQLKFGWACSCTTLSLFGASADQEYDLSAWHLTAQVFNCCCQQQGTMNVLRLTKIYVFCQIWCDTQATTCKKHTRTAMRNRALHVQVNSFASKSSSHTFFMKPRNVNVKTTMEILV